MPNADDKAFLSLSSRDLAERFGRPVFAPHLTLRGGTVAAPDRLPRRSLSRRVGETAPLPSGLNALRAQLLADAATKCARTGKSIAIEAVGR